MAKPLYHHRRKLPNAPPGCNGFSFPGKDAYDDVLSAGLNPKFGAPAAPPPPPGFSSRRVASEDFAEIFGGRNGTRGSSIPVLDLSDLDDGNGSGDFRSSGGRKLDYSMIFGGGDDVPAAVPAYEELFTGVKKAKRNEAKARISAGTGSPLRGSEHFNASDNIKSDTREASDQILDSGKQFNMSYHKTGERRKDVLNGTTHIAQLNAVPGFTYVIDGTARVRKTQQDKATPLVQSEVNQSRSSSDGLQKTRQDKAMPPVKVESNSRGFGEESEGKSGTRTRWQLPTTNASEGLVTHKVECNRDADHSRDQLLNGNDVGLKSHCQLPTINASEGLATRKVECNRDADHSRDKLFNGDDVGLKSHFSEEPSSSTSSANLKDSKGHSKVSKFSSFGPKVEASEVTSGYATPFSDEELDVNSAAAASVEALKKAIEQAQESIRLAKEKMERKLRSRDNLKANGGREVNNAQEANNTRENNVKETSKNPESEAQYSMESDQEMRLGSGGVFSGFIQKDNPITGRQAVAELHCENVDVAEDNGVATWFNQLLSNGKQKMASLASELVVKENNILQPMDKDTDKVEEIKPAKATLEWDTTGKVNNVDRVLQSGKTGTKINVLGRSKELEKTVGFFDSSQCVNEEKPSETLIFTQKDEVTENRQHDSDKEGNGAVNPENCCETSGDIQFELHKLGEVLQENKSLKVEEKSFEQEAGRKLTVFSVGDEDDGRLDGVEINKQQEDFLLGVDNEDVVYNEDLAVRNEDDEPTLATDSVSNGKRQEDDIDEGYDKQESNEQRLARSVEREEKQILSEEEEVWEGNDRRPARPHENGEASNIDDDADNNSLNQKIEVNEELQKSMENPTPFQEAVFKLSLDATFDASSTCGSANLVDFQDTCRSEVENVTEQTSQVEFRNYEETGDLPGFAEGSSQQKSRKNEFVADKFGFTEYLHELDGDAKAEQAVEVALIVTGEHTMETSGVDCINAENIMESLMPDISDATAAGSGGNAATFCFKKMVHDSEQSKDYGIDGFSNNGIKQDIRDDGYAAEASADNKPLNSDFNDLRGQTQIHENDRKFKFPCNTEISDGSVHEGCEQNHIEESHVESESSIDHENGYCVLQETLGNVENDNGDGIGCEEKIEEDNIERCQEEGERVWNEKASESSHLAGEEDVETNSHGKTDQSSDEENVFRTLMKEVEETRETVQKEEVGKDDVETSEVKKRDRDREKDRMAVERAIREARERAFAEARERAERAAVEKAAAEVRQRAMAEAREKLDKVSSGPKAPVDKASIAAKLRAERAAVERATAEAHERALEKALSQKNTSDTRTQPERDPAGKFPGYSRDGRLKHSFSSSDLENFDGTNSESAQRRKARLERHQRIMERAAKALAEKNLRDVLAQREQAQKNRLAETLDAEIKRWASGKEGNLRALLSTLQYILGPGSGWQPISLTEIVTTAAVKKAYRKATLYVHPDKLQQRGASIQQKYICEKVFDLLKAAWNKFNSEER